MFWWYLFLVILNLCIMRYFDPLPPYLLFLLFLFRGSSKTDLWNIILLWLETKEVSLYQLNIFHEVLKLLALQPVERSLNLILEVVERMHIIDVCDSVFSTIMLKSALIIICKWSRRWSTITTHKIKFLISRTNRHFLLNISLSNLFTVLIVYRFSD